MRAKYWPCCRVGLDFVEQVHAGLEIPCETWAPVVGPDSLCRLQRHSRQALAPLADLPAIPFKKLLLPECEAVWSWDGQGFAAPEAPPWRIVFGVAGCDLQALGYLDRVFADDPVYQLRRERLLVIGSPCQPADSCACDPGRLPLGGDLFWSGGQAWALSEKGRGILMQLASSPDAVSEQQLPQPAVARCHRPSFDEDLFKLGSTSAIWRQEGGRCLTCGACSAACPTCYCYDMIDRASLDGDVIRQRTWDNCFFADHAGVAGGHDFRSDRAARLRFRFEHKILGFGSLRGVPSCVGCGRCRKVCPSDVDLDQIAASIVAELAS